MTTSALAGTSLAAVPAIADAPVMTFSGALAYEFVMFDGDVADAGTGTNITANDQQSELVWDARGSADNGLNYRANIQWRWTIGGGAGNAGVFDEAWIDFTGGFGRLYIGGEDGVSDLVAGTSGHTVQVGTWGTDGNNALRHVNFLGMNTALAYYASHNGMTGDANKVGYVTPSFGGFSAGISYSPNSGFAQTAGTNNDANANAFEFAAGWAGGVGDFTMALDGSYGIADNQIGTLGFERESVSAYMLGGMIGVSGFQVAGAFLENGDSSCLKGAVSCDSGSAWNLGASYRIESTALSMMWQSSEEDIDGNGQNDTAKILHAGVSHQIVDGLSAHLNGYWFDLENEAGSGVRTNSNDATVVILGTRITF